MMGSTPPSVCGRKTCGRSSTLHGGNDSPSGATSVRSRSTRRTFRSRTLGAVEKRVEHLRVQSAHARIFGGEAVVPPHRVRRRCVIRGQILGALAGGDRLRSRTRAPSRPSRRSARVGRRRRANTRCRLRARVARSSGPASASASTLTITMCLRCSQQASTCVMPATVSRWNR